jgi:hypothetical protein
MSTKYHFVITIEILESDGSTYLATFEDVVEWYGGSRQSAFTYCRSSACREFKCEMNKTAVVFWAFEPDSLP